jgi:hypothetical protein
VAAWPHRTVTAPPKPRLFRFPSSSTPSNFDNNFSSTTPSIRPPRRCSFGLGEERKKIVRRSPPRRSRNRQNFQVSKKPGRRRRGSGAATAAFSPEQYNKKSLLGRVSAVHRSLRVCRCRASLPNLIRGKERGAFLHRW